MLNEPNPAAISSLLGRRSVKARDLGAPGPDAAAIETILAAGMRVPDHGKLAPTRFFVFEGRARQDFGETIAACYRAETPNASEKIADGFVAFATAAPLMIALVSVPSDEKPIPHFEQLMSTGASGMAMLIAAHMLGYAGNWLTGWAATSPGVRAALGLGAADRIAGFLFFGTAQTTPEERVRPDPAKVIRRYRARFTPESP
ncbi:MAG: nitroreductase [Rhodothalassiaceae bacterium]